MTDYEALMEAAHEEMGRPLTTDPDETAEVQIERKCDWIIRQLDELTGMASNPETVDLIDGQRIAMGQMNTRIQLILSFLMARKPAPSHIRRVS